MNKDRGMIKWMPFNSVVSNKEILYSLMREKEKRPKPIISDDDKKLIEESIIDAFYMQNKVTITYYNNGLFYTYFGPIKKIDSSNKLIYLNNLKLLFNQITGVTDIKE